MPQYFLIDTNIWVYLMSHSWEKEELDKIEKLVQEDHIRLLVSELLLEEWQDQKRKKLRALKELLSSAEKNVPEEITSSHLKPQFLQTDQTADRITSLLENGISFTVSDKVVVDIFNRSRKKLAPYHVAGNKPVQNDAAIYFSTVEYVQQEELVQFIFVSNNFHDFGDPKNKQNLHPDLVQENIQIQYYHSIKQCFYILKELFPLSDFKSESESNASEVITFSDVNYEAPILDTLYKVLTLITEQINFVPVNILANINPFRIDDEKASFSHYTNFIIYTNNIPLIDFFRTVEIQKREVRFKEGSGYENSAENIEKIKFIIEFLNENLVYEIGSMSVGEPVDLRIADKENCDCISCNYKNLQFERVLSKLYDGTDTDQLQKAFIAFQLGLYGTSLDYYYSIYKSAIQKNQKLLKYRMQLHLKWVSGFISSVYTKNNAAVVNDIKSFNMQKEFETLSSSSIFDRKIGAFLYDGIFNYHYSTEISDVLEQIRDNYNLQLGGGYSSNSNYWNLLGQYGEFESFIVSNCMPFTNYSNFKKTFEKFLEGIFLSYALNQYQPSRLKYLTGFHIHQMIFNGTPGKISELYVDFIQEKIALEEEAVPELEKMILNYFEGAAEFVSSSYAESFSRKVHELEHGKYFWNIIIIASIFKLHDTFIKRCGDLVFKYLKETENISIPDLKYLGSFIIVNGKALGREYLQKIFKLFITNPTFHHRSLFSSFSRIQKTKPPTLISRRKDFEVISEMFLTKCKKCGSSHVDWLFDLLPLMTRPFQKELSGIINNELEETFDHKIYYLASLHGIIDYRRFFSNYMEIFGAPSKGWKDHPFFLAGEIEHPELSQLINLVFKYNIQLPEEFKERVKGYSDYYEWLIDMKNFNYEKFNPLWIIQFRTRYYLKEIFKHKKIREKVKLFLQTNPQPLLARTYALYVG